MKKRRPALFLLAVFVGIFVLGQGADPVSAVPLSETKRISIGPVGEQSNYYSLAPAVSANGRYVAFNSSASNLVAGDTNGTSDIFVRDLVAEQTARVSMTASGTQANGSSSGAAISASGRYVAFRSTATNLVGGDTNQVNDIFRVDRDVDGNGVFDEVGETSIVRGSVASDGSQAEGSDAWFSQLDLSEDGRSVAFVSSTSNLVLGDTNGVEDVFVHDFLTGKTTRVSVANDGTQGNDDSSGVAISANGQLVGFTSRSSNLVPGDTNNIGDVFVYDRDADGNGIFDESTGFNIRRVSVDSSGNQANGYNGCLDSLSFSGDSRFFAFSCDATNLVTDVLPGGTHFHVYLHDLLTGETSLAAVDSAGKPENGGSRLPALSEDGRFITFSSDSTNLDSDQNIYDDIYLRDRLEGRTTRVSVSRNEYTYPNSHSTTPAISGDGSVVAYISAASNLVQSDTNDFDDVFVYTPVPNKVDIAIPGSKVAESPTIINAYASFNSVLPLTYTWTATGQDPVTHENITIHSDSAVFTWPSPGDVTVTVQATNSAGSFEDTKTFTMHNPIQVDFSYSNYSGAPPNAVQFHDISSSVDPITGSDWDFGDGSTSHGTFDPTHTYPGPGTYTVTLKSKSVWGFATKAKEITVPLDVPLDAEFITNQTAGVAPHWVQFSDASYGNPTSWFWDFGDSSSSTEQNPSHIYTIPGTYTVSLTSQRAGETDTETRVGYITIYTPVQSDFTVDHLTGIAPLSVHFSSQSTGDYTSLTWNLGEDSPTVQGPTASHTYTTKGLHWVTLTAAGPGGVSISSQAVQVYQPVQANFATDHTYGIAPLQVSFFNLTSGDDSSWSWNFGDGGTSSEEKPTHLYTAPGIYSVSLESTGQGGTDSQTATDYIRVYAPSQAGFTLSTDTGIGPLQVTFNSTSAGDFTSLEWDFGDGTPKSTVNPVNHTFASTGSYPVTLSVDGPGGSSTTSKVIHVYQPVQADFSADGTTGLPSLSVQFTDLSTGDHISHSWTFGDGEFSTGENPRHVYQRPGKYTVELTVSGPGGSQTKTRTQYILIKYPVYLPLAIRAN